MRTASAAIASVVLLAGGASAQSFGQCDAGADCIFTVPYGSSTASFDLRGLCNPDQDYVISDPVFGHTYYAQICGAAQKSCLPFK